MTITYLTGDATQPTPRPAVIAHVCNDAGRWGAGFTGAISRHWPGPEAEYRARHRTVGLLLGTIHVVEVGRELWVANMVAQHGIGQRNGPPIRYEALRWCLEHVAAGARQVGAVVAMPRIGCGLAGGRWADVEPIIAETCADLPVIVYDLPEVG